jgi:hypothetical protein
MKIVSYASMFLASTGSASAAMPFDQGRCEMFCPHGNDGFIKLTSAQESYRYRYKGINQHDCRANCAKSCDEGFDVTSCKEPCHLAYGEGEGICHENCDAKGCAPPTSAPTSPPTLSELEVKTLKLEAMTKQLAIANANLATMEKAQRHLNDQSAPTIDPSRYCADPKVASDIRNRWNEAGFDCNDYSHDPATCVKIGCSWLASELPAVNAKLAIHTASKVSQAKLKAVKECKAKSPNYKAPVNDECNPKNCDEWDCGQWCVCYNADHDAIYEVLGCTTDDEETCRCD